MNYDMITADGYIYADILQKICIGVYSFQDILPTINEMCEQYGFAATTVKKAMKRLRDEGLVKGETCKGTRVIFDRGNLEHIDRLRNCSKQLAISEYNDIEIPSTLLAGVVEAGFMHMKPEGKERLSCLAEHTLQKLREEKAFIFEPQQFLRDVVAQTENKFMTDIVDDVFRQFIVFIPSRKADEEAYLSYIKLVTVYLEKLRDILLIEERGKTQEVTQIFYEGINKIPNTFALVPANHHGVFLRKEKLYNIVMWDMVAEIISGKIKKGAYFPSTPQMCELHKVDRRTICKAYEILEQLRLIQVVPYKGARLVSDWEDPVTRSWIIGQLEERMQSVSQALEVFDVLYRDIIPLIAAHATEEMVDEMEARLHSQWTDANNNQTLLLVTEALMTPITSSISSETFHKHYDFLLKTVTDFLVLSLLQPFDTKSHKETIYQEAEAAIIAIRNGDLDEFYYHFSRSVRYNKQIYKEIIIQINRSIDKDSNHYKGD